MTKPRRTLDELPGPAERGGYVYALLFTTGVAQVGRTTDARAEVTARRAFARSLGVDLADWWVSVPHAEWITNEQWLRELCSLDGTRTGPGCYSGVRFDLLTGKAHELPFNETRAAGRRNRRAAQWDNADTRMATAVRLKAEGKSLRWIAGRLNVSPTTIARDLARWERVKDSVPLEVRRLSRPAVTPPCNSGRPDQASSTTAVTAASDIPSTVIQLRRPA
jgi:hypothetical protein